MPLLAPSQGLLPARAGSPLAGRVSHPLDDVQSFMKVSPPPIPFDQPCLVALIFLSVLRRLSPSAGMRPSSVAPCKHGIGMWSTPSGIQVPDEPLGLSVAGHLAV